jgi:hypothetical protein
MKIYFGFTVAGDRSSMVAARKIVELVVQMGHEVLTHHLVEDNAWEADRLITPKEVYLRDMNWLKRATCLWRKCRAHPLAWASRPGTCWEQLQRKSSCFIGEMPKPNISSNHGHRREDVLQFDGTFKRVQRRVVLGSVSSLSERAARKLFQPYLNRVNDAVKAAPKTGMTLEQFETDVQHWRFPNDAAMKISG